MSIGTAVEIRETDIDEILEAGAHLIRSHWEEVALHKDIMVLDPDVLRYKALEQQDKLLCLGAFDGTGIIGYSISLLTTHLHYSDLLYAQNDVLFVAAAQRKSRIGLQLIVATESAAKQLGARMICWHAKPGTALDRILDKSRTYIIQDVLYSRRL